MRPHGVWMQHRAQHHDNIRHTPRDTHFYIPTPSNHTIASILHVRTKNKSGPSQLLVGRRRRCNIMRPRTYATIPTTASLLLPCHILWLLGCEVF